MIAFRAPNGRFVTISGGDMMARALSFGIGPYEKFRVVSLGGGAVGLKSIGNGHFLIADGGGSLPLVANRPVPGLWGSFIFSDLPPSGMYKILLLRLLYVTPF